MYGKGDEEIYVHTFQCLISYVYISLVKSPHLDALIHLRLPNIIAKEGGRQRLKLAACGFQRELITGYGTKRGMWTRNWRCKDQELLKLRNILKTNKRKLQKQGVHPEIVGFEHFSDGCN